MNERPDSIQRLFQTLARHASLLSEAFVAPVAGGDRQREAAISALVAAGALKPYEEGTYYLSAPLYEYCSAMLTSFHALQALTRINGHIYQASCRWSELKLLRLTGHSRDIGRVEAALERAVMEIGEIVERNISLLNAMVRGQYGNVENLQSKMRQNRFYAREVVTSLDELKQVEELVRTVDDGAVGDGLARMRQLVQRRLGARLLSWAARLNDAQSVISKRLFEARLMERRLKQLARYASWLAANPTQAGWDLEVPDTVDVALCRPEAIGHRPQPDFFDAMAGNAASLVEAAHRLPRQAASLVRQPVRQEQADDEVLSDELASFEVPLQAHEIALERLVVELDERARRAHFEPVSLAQWKADAEQRIAGLAETPLEHWLIYAATQLRSGEYKIGMLRSDLLEEFPVNTQFFDIEVAHRRGRAVEAASTVGAAMPG